MPTYDYKCADCGRLFEKFHGMNEQPQVLCPDCQSVNTARQVSLGAGIVFKGAGFYVNDYKKTASDSGGGGASAAAKTETKEKNADVKAADSTSADSTTKSAHVHGPGCSHG